MTASFNLLWSLCLSQLIYCIHCAPRGHVCIVYLGHSHGREPVLTARLHVKLLSDVFSSQEEAEEAMVYSYGQGFSGFAALLNS